MAENNENLNDQYLTKEELAPSVLRQGDWVMNLNIPSSMRFNKRKKRLTNKKD